jgi:Phosphodiester glycosidase
VSTELQLEDAGGPPLPSHVARLRVTGPGDLAATAVVARYTLPSWRALVRVVAPAERLEKWCEANGIEEAHSAGFAVKPELIPLGELRMGGKPVDHQSFTAPWDARRGCLHIEGDRVAIVGRDELGDDPDGDVLQAGPILLRDKAVQIHPGGDPEGFVETQHEFDQDITADREPRSAIAVGDGELLTIVVEGRAPHESGMLLHELAELALALGARDALNLDGGSASALVAGGIRVNRPRSDDGDELEHSEPTTSAVVFERAAC